MAMDFLKNLADQTSGSLHLLTADKNGNIRDVEKISLIDSEISSLSSLDSRKVWFQDENKFNGHFHQRNGGWYPCQKVYPFYCEALQYFHAEKKKMMKSWL